MNIDRIKLLKPEPEDIIVVTLPRTASVSDYKATQGALRDVFPDRHFITVPNDVDIKTLGVDDLRQIGLQKLTE